jgi:hypothetical protein
MHGRARGSCDPRPSRCFPFRARCAFSKRTASPALTAAVLAESPLANSVSEREANDQADSNFQHSDSAEGRRDPARANNTAQGRGLGNPLSSALVTCFMRVRLGNAAFCGRVPFGPTWIAAAPLRRTAARDRVRPVWRIRLATSIVGSVRSTNPSLPRAASNAADMLAMSSGPNE